MCKLFHATLLNQDFARLNGNVHNMRIYKEKCWHAEAKKKNTCVFCFLLLKPIIIQYSYNLVDCDWLKNLQTILDILPPTKYQKLSEVDVIVNNPSLWFLQTKLTS